MNNEDKKIASLLTELGLTTEQIKIYLTLLKHKELTALELSRASGINRTCVYRLLEKMTKMGLIEEMVDQYRKKSRAVGIDGLERLVKEQQERTKKISLLLPEVTSFLSGKAGLREENTKVLFYRGFEGIRQIVWNVLKTQGEDLGYTYIDVDEALGRELAEDWRREVVKRKIHFRDITSNYQVFEHSKDTKVPGFLELCQTRYISPDKLTIDHQVDIYNDVISLYSWKEGDVFGVEIYNPTIVRLQKQIFNLLWENAQKKSFAKEKSSQRL